MGVERIWAASCQRAMVGPLFDELERIGDDRRISMDEDPKMNIIRESAGPQVTHHQMARGPGGAGRRSTIPRFDSPNQKMMRVEDESGSKAGPKWPERARRPRRQIPKAGRTRLLTAARQTKLQYGASSRRFEIRPLSEQTATRHLRTSG